jgi:hypothetical protein
MYHQLPDYRAMLTPEAIDAAISRLAGIDYVERVDELLGREHALRIETLEGEMMYRFTLTHADGVPVLSVETDKVSSALKVLAFASTLDSW